MLVFWIALPSSGSDWFISETHADIIYTGLRRFGEFPFFSFVFNGGMYFLQDPQSNMFSPAVPLILLAGPSVGLRLMEGAWGALGIYAFTVWMERRVSMEAALLGAVASVTSLGVLWKIAVGNDMFLWHLGLPGLLWAVEKVMSERTVRSALLFGLVLGLLLLGPTFHSFTYLFLPVVPLFILLEWAFHRPKLVEFAKTVALLLGACALALLIVSPKLACWAKFPMHRSVDDSGVIGLGSTIRALLNYSATKHSVVPTSSITSSGALAHGGWGLEDCAVAMPPIATLLALVGLLSPIRSRGKRPTAFLAVLLIAWGVALSCWWPLWNEFRTLTGGNFRVAPRFLGIAAFGLAILVALGADTVFTRRKRAAFPATLAMVGVMLGSAVWWTLSAAQFTGQSADDTVHRDAINPFKRAVEEWTAAGHLTTFTTLTALDRAQRTILTGVGYSDGFFVVGSPYDPWLGNLTHPVPIVVRGIDPSQVTVEHLRITLNHLAPHTKVALHAQQPEFGLSVVTRPANAPIDVRLKRSYLLVENRGDAPVDQVVLRAQLPISIAWFIGSGAGLLGAAVALVVLKRQGVRGLPVPTRQTLASR